ncbi:hypothetical protein HPB47_018756 [Ixodes persulcatus]|uniref:Uncharacterized protein n=1 Tax=Ixodes persulcatus TaxID=34615 RepID=A0AC60QJY3_IXOPE|nr:hypothetical protein HPB47_018756 [Ixodes persulcatus]
MGVERKRRLAAVALALTIEDEEDLSAPPRQLLLLTLQCKAVKIDTSVQPLDMSGDLEISWRTWWDQLKLSSTAAALKSQDAKVQATTFQVVVGEDARRVYITFTFESPGDELRVEKIAELFEKHCKPAINVSYRDFVFGTRNQHDGERFKDWPTELRTLAKQCDFGEPLCLATSEYLETQSFEQLVSVAKCSATNRTQYHTTQQTELPCSLVAPPPPPLLRRRSPCHRRPMPRQLCSLDKAILDKQLGFTASLEGCNVTVLAYGQTGSGKTFTMGTSCASQGIAEDAGIIQRAIQDIFGAVAECQARKDVKIKVSFLEGSLLLIPHEVLANSPKCDPRVIMAVDFKGTFNVSIMLRNEALALGFCSPLF